VPELRITLETHITSISGFAEVDSLFGRKPKFTRADFIPLARVVADPMAILVNDPQPYAALSRYYVSRTSLRDLLQASLTRIRKRFTMPGGTKRRCMTPFWSYAASIS
jgi:hypothetical protein